MGIYETKDTISGVTKDGTYTIKCKAEPATTAAASSKPDGLSMLNLVIMGEKSLEDAKVTLDSVKVDGKEIELINKEPANEGYDTLLSATLFVAEDLADLYDEYKECFKDIGTWEEIEVTFEIKGIK